MKKRLILVGKAASGKDHARKICEQWFGMPYAVSYTTRPPRDGEIDGKDYNFLSTNDFNKMIDEDLWYEYVKFNGWYYGTTQEQMRTVGNVFIMTPHGMSHLSVKDRRDSLVVYIDVEEEIRRVRMSQRGNYVDSIDRRVEADRIDFANFEDYDAKITNPYYYILDLYNIIAPHMDLPDKDPRLPEFAEKYVRN